MDNPLSVSEIEQRLREQNIPIPSAWDSFKGLFPGWMPKFVIVAIIVIAVCYLINFTLFALAINGALMTVIVSMVRQSQKALKEARKK